MERPVNPYFSSGPCKKYSSFDLNNLSNALLNRAHKSKDAVKRLNDVLQLTKEILQVPQDYKIVLTPGSDTGAIESCFWCMLGERVVDIISCEYFGEKWINDIDKQLKIKNNVYNAEYGKLPNLTEYNPDNDLVFVLNATTSGVYIPNFDWIPSDREGITICDATSGLFAMDVDWSKLDATTFSWQKILGGEAGFGMIILSPKAINRLNTYNPDRAIPIVLSLKNKNGTFNEDLACGGTVNTFSLLLLEDYYLALKDLKSKGGVQYAIEKVKKNYQVIEEFVFYNEWINFLVKNKLYRSPISVTLVLPELSDKQISDLIATLEQENVAFDIWSHFAAPKGLRIWCGPTVETCDIRLLFDCIERIVNDMLSN
jgi:phosphoserine aminotransferase